MTSPEARDRLDKLFNNHVATHSKAVESEDDSKGTPLSEIPGLTSRVISLLQSGGVNDVETLIEMQSEDLAKIPGVGLTTSEQILRLLSESVEFVEEG